MTGRLQVRRVATTFEVRKITEDNAVELALWLRDAGNEQGVSPGSQPVVSYAGAKPVLVPTSYDVSPFPIGSWIGWGWPAFVLDGDVVRPKLVCINEEAIQPDRRDQGIEVVEP